MKNVFLFAIMLSFLFYGCTNQSQKTEQKQMTEADMQLLETANRYFSLMPEPNDPNTPLAILGKKLYYEESLSANGKISCNTCHPIATYGVDNLPTSPGHDGSVGTRNSPTTFNAYFHVAQFWDGRSPDLADQAKGPVLNPIEMGLQSATDVEAILKANEEYSKMFKEAFPEQENPVTFDNFAIAIAEFEGTLATPAAFDAFLEGAVNELDSEQKEGLSLFIETGCIACHIGPGLGGNMMQRFGLVHGPYWDFTGSENKDRGVADLTGKESDQDIFKSPSLRNIEMTAPYFHDGSIESLEEAIRIMAYTQLGKELNEDQINKMVKFFKSLTGEIPEHAL
jgi:cytochrome c peroxidase